MDIFKKSLLLVAVLGGGGIYTWSSINAQLNEVPSFYRNRVSSKNKDYADIRNEYKKVSEVWKDVFKDWDAGNGSGTSSGGSR